VSAPSPAIAVTPLSEQERRLKNKTRIESRPVEILYGSTWTMRAYHNFMIKLIRCFWDRIISVISKICTINFSKIQSEFDENRHALITMTAHVASPRAEVEPDDCGLNRVGSNHPGAPGGGTAEASRAGFYVSFIFSFVGLENQ
jgi:hypothetical protein